MLFVLFASLMKAFLAVLCCREAWKALGDSSPSQAMQEYIAAVKKLDPGWNPQVRLLAVYFLKTYFLQTNVSN
jgi:hypothetical protein